MRITRRRIARAARVTSGALCAAAALAPAASAQTTDDARYALANGCYALRSENAGKFVARTASGYAATAADAASAEPFRMQATALGRYLLYGKGGTMLVAGDAGAVGQSTDPGPPGDFTITGTDSGFTLTHTGTSDALVAAADGTIGLGAAGQHFTFAPAQGCAVFPEAADDVTGPVYKGPTPYGDTQGFIDAHMHMMGFEFLGGDVHCGRPWDPYGITVALHGCTGANAQASDAVQTVLDNNPGDSADDPVGWPTFKDWPRWNALTHEQSYYKWLERAWRGGERIFVNLFVENNALCEVYPFKHNSCNEMDSVRLQAKDLRALQDYIDAQNGGPGKGWFRIVSDPFQARRVINEGKMAIVPGIEVSNLFDCGEHNGVSDCTNSDVDTRLAQVYNDLGVRDMELINKFDNGFGGVAGDANSTGAIVNVGNHYETGSFWDLKKCTGPAEESDHPQYTLPAPLADPLAATLPDGTLPVYPAGPECNQRGLTDLGRHLVSDMMSRHMIIDPDHLDVIARDNLLDEVEAAKYSGIISSHSWSTPETYPRIYKLGGMVTPYAGGSTSFANAWKTLRKEADPRFYWGFGWGADMNGFGAQGAPRGGTDPVSYPFKSADGLDTISRQKTGDRTFDINTDGVAHYGLYPDWIEDLRHIAGDQIVKDLQRGPEMYLEMWERADGVRASYLCHESRLRYTAAGIGTVPLGAPAEDVLRSAGQPVERVGRTYGYCVGGRGNAKKRLTVVFTKAGTAGLITSNAPRHRVKGIGAGSKASKLKGTKRLRAGLLAKSAGHGKEYLFGVKGGRVTFTGLASSGVAASARELSAELKLAGVAR